MINLFRLRRPIAMLALLTITTSCTSEAEVQMTPEQSRQVFIAEATAVIQSVFPAADPLIVVIEKDAPCGGPVGTESSSVESSINVHSDASDDRLDADQVFKKVVDVLKQRDWKINYTHNRIAGAERKGVGGISAGVGDSPVGINISGRTECVKNPDA